MVNKNTTIIVLVLVVIFGLYFYFTAEPVVKEEKPVATNIDPQNTSYIIDGKTIPLKDGRYEEVLMPTSVTKIEVAIFGEPIYSDLDGDGDDDASLYLTYNAGGSETFYYLAVSINNDNTYIGTEAMLLGDRIAPQNINVSHEIVMANYADKNIDEPMTTSPSVGKTLYAYIKDAQLVQIFVSGTNESVYFGNLMYGNEARTFTTCQGEEYWIVGTNEYLGHIQDLYEGITADLEPYTKVFVVMSGGIVDAPTDGFGADYDYGFSPKEIIKTSLTDVCE